jgi:cold shock CspA family protein
MEEGTIIVVKLERGYGFLSNGRRDVFFHCRSLRNLAWDETLTERRVRFLTEWHNGRERAAIVEPAD